MDRKITYKSFGEKAILIEWKASINIDLLKDILNFKSKVEKSNLIFADLIVGYNSLTIKFKEKITNFLIQIDHLKSIYKSKDKVIQFLNYLWEIPVCYDVEFGIDLEEISKSTRLNKEQIIKLHSNKIYTVFFTGFLPGFLYLGGLNRQLFIDRKATPRLQIKKGSIAIGGKQTGVYPLNSPGGWNIIGKTPVNFFNITKEAPCFANSGDKIQFKPISIEEFYKIEKEVIQNSYQLSKILLND
ncbi:MAG: 5-oxoprolinase subunit PxpB [Polaribacter sp.]|uniref:5-oxoprolinase subunit PxpB n=1 Tax=Polaribacter sp. TaxID=1920175 RepID=UPI0032647AA7